MGVVRLSRGQVPGRALCDIERAGMSHNVPMTDMQPNRPGAPMRPPPGTFGQVGVGMPENR